jgi:hypothetical protein
MGKNKYIETPQKLWELFIQYEKETKENPKLVHDYLGKEVQAVYRERERPLTMEGFEDFVCEHTKISYPDLTHYFENTDNRYADYVPISSRIRRRIRKDQIEGGMTMIYSQSITARLNNLIDRNETTHKQEQTLLDDLRKNDKSK